MPHPDEIADAREADDADRAEAHATDAYFAWEDAQAALIEGDPSSPQHVEGHVFMQARAGAVNEIILIGSFFDTSNGPMRVRREHAIEMRDFLTGAIEGTLEPEVRDTRPPTAETESDLDL